MEEKIVFEIKDTCIRCDKCGYEDLESSWKDPKKVFKKWTGNKCPKCGEIMLTKDAEERISACLSTIEFANIENGQSGLK